VLSVDPKTLGIQTGMNQTFRNLGSALGPVLVTSILASYAFTQVLSGFAFENYQLVGYQVVFALVGVSGIVGLIFSLMLRNFRFLSDGSRTGQQSGAPTAEGEVRDVAPVARAATRPTPGIPASEEGRSPLRTDP